MPDYGQASEMHSKGFGFESTRARMTQELDMKAFEIFWKSETSKDIKK